MFSCGFEFEQITSFSDGQEILRCCFVRDRNEVWTGMCLIEDLCMRSQHLLCEETHKLILVIFGNVFDVFIINDKILLCCLGYLIEVFEREL